MNAILIRVPAEVVDASLSDAQSIRYLIQHSGGSSRLDLGESWAGLHFVLTGELPIPRHEAVRRGLSWNEASLENVLMGGTVVQNAASWGPARYLAPAAVARLAASLYAIDVEKFLAWYDADALMEEKIPPGEWVRNHGARDWLVGNFVKLVGFYKAAAHSGDGILICTQ